MLLGNSVNNNGSIDVNMPEFGDLKIVVDAGHGEPDRRSSVK